MKRGTSSCISAGSYKWSSVFTSEYYICSALDVITYWQKLCYSPILLTDKSQWLATHVDYTTNMVSQTYAGRTILYDKCTLVDREQIKQVITVRI